jgi:hypothetical protein
LQPGGDGVQRFPALPFAGELPERENDDRLQEYGKQRDAQPDERLGKISGPGDQAEKRKALGNVSEEDHPARECQDGGEGQP